MSDIVERLRQWSGGKSAYSRLMVEAADEIMRLRGLLAETVPDPEYRRMQDQEIERLRAALRDLIDRTEAFLPLCDDNSRTHKDVDAARRALREKP